jgi:hypothetical protein
LGFKKRIVCSLFLLVLPVHLVLFSVVADIAVAGTTDVSPSVQHREIGRSLSAPVEAEHFIFHPGNRGVRFYFMLGHVPESIYKEMAARYHYKQQKKIDFYVYSDRDKFIEESPSKDAAGYAVPSENKIAIMVDGDPQDWQATIAHEINHIIFIQSVPKIGTVPQWFIEGLAIYESHPGLNVARLEEQALAKDLPDIISSRVDPGPAELKDYGQGYLLVGFIVSEYGREALDNIIVKLQSGADFNSAVIRTLSVTPEELNNRSKAFVRTELFYIWLLKIQDFQWYFATVLFVVAGTIAFARKRRQLSGLKDNDDNTDYSPGAALSDENEFEGVDFGDGAKV